MDPVIAIFVLVYVGMVLGGVPGLRIDRTGVALLGAIALVATGELRLAAAWRAADVPTLALLVGLMVLSAQLRLGGFYTAVTFWLARRGGRPESLLLQVVLAAGGLSALLVNDIICLAMAPVLIDICQRRRLDPVPFLLALMAASNIGSAATLIGNPQNMLIGQRLGMSFGGYLLTALPPVILSLLSTWGMLCLVYRRRFVRDLQPAPAAERAFDGWQTGKGLLALVALVIAFLATSWPREVVTLAVAGLLLCSRRLASHEMLGLVDWQLCLLFFGLFVVNHALAESGHLTAGLDWLRAVGVEPSAPVTLFGLSVVGSNIVSNVPSVMLLLPIATHPDAGAVLALSSTFAGNLFLVGSIANLIVVEQARRLGVAPIGRSWVAEHLRVGIPITLVSLALAGLWLAVV